MNTVKHLNGSNLQPLPKRRLIFWNKHYVACAVLASLIGTYLDLFCVGKGMYQFPLRLLPKIFPINIIFTLLGLPIFVMMFTYCIHQVNKWGKAGIILFVSLLMSILERLAEKFGFFIHSNKWEHVYTFFGYMVFLTVITLYFHWLKSE
ncbi:CBO0543 family protein [Neobacillus fumarioli]|uniref:CBO0543 family protein n=1 Tax=Neobacillus fumarioli TaxID=105229 RepID=UPI00082ECEE4|nr:CBO0543 family protein [Neobacillus fumarioli]